MAHTIANTIDRIDLDKEYWVDIKSKMGYGDQQRLVSSYMNVKAKGQDDVDIGIETGNITLLLLNVKAWNLVDAAGNILPMDKVTMELLDPAVARKIVKEITKRNPPPKA